MNNSACEHNAGLGFDYPCPACWTPTPEEIERGERYRSVGLHYAYGRQDFHGPTLRERQDRQIAEARAAGVNPEPAGTRWV